MTFSDMQHPGSGVGPQAGGFAPTPADAMASQIRQASSQQLMQYALYSDPRTRAMAGMMARGLAGDAASAEKLLSKTGTGQALKDASAFMMNSGVIPGGNPANLAYNVQGMMSSQGFRLGGNMANGGQLFGSGFVTDTLSKKVFDEVRGNFYSSTTGLGKSNAFGMNMNQMGDAMGFLQSRGAFAGKQIASLNHYGNKDEIKRARDVASSEGGQDDFIKELDALSAQGGKGFAMKIDKAQMKKVNDVFSNFAGTLRDAKEIFGNLPVGELAQNAERLIGTSITEMGAIGSMRNRMASIKAVSSAFGMNPEAAAQAIMNSADATRTSMMNNAMQDPRNMNSYNAATLNSSVGRTASAIANGAFASSIYSSTSNNEYALQQAQNGKYVRTFDQQQVHAGIANGVQTLMQEKSTNMPYSLVAASLLDQGQLTGKAADTTSSLLHQLGSAKSAKEIKDINLKLRDTVNGSGFNMSEILRNNTMEELQGSMSLGGVSSYTDTMQKQLSSRSYNSLTLLNKQGNDKGMLKSWVNKENFFKLMQTLDAPSLSDVTGAISDDGSIDDTKLTEAYNNNKGLAGEISQDNMRNMLVAMTSSSDRDKSGSAKDQFGNLVNAFKGSARNMDVVSSMDKKAGEKRAAQSYLASISQGGPMNKEDFETAIMRGFFDAGQISDASAMQYAKDTGNNSLMSLAINNDRSGVIVSEGDLGKLDANMGEGTLNKLYQKFNLKAGDTKGLAAAMSADNKGLDALKELKGDASWMISDDKLDMLGGKATSEVKGKLEKDAMVAQARALMGDGYGADAKLDTADDVASFKSNLSEDFKKDPSKMNKLLEGIDKSGYGGKDFEALSRMYKADPTLKNSLKEGEDKLRTEAADSWWGGDEKRKKADSIRNLRNQLETSSGGNKFLGVLEIASDSLASLKLYSSQ